VPGSSLDWGVAGTTVVVTGASSGIGAATAKAGPGCVRTAMLQPHPAANEGCEDRILDRTPVRRIGGPEELATTIVYLLSPLSTHVDGGTLVADGRWIAQ
jgi:NAD(P)-dependent dehydrogenase (short-subunit alcohol dehydrogenase family)